MAADRAASAARSRSEYLHVLRRAGYEGSGASASTIVTREAKRAFNGTRARQTRTNPSATKGRTRGRKPSAATVLLRKRLAADQSKKALRPAAWYIRWLADAVHVEAKRVRPLVYRELRKK
jgi:hypothetical protein